MIRMRKVIAVLALGVTTLPLASCVTPIDLAANAGLGVAQAGTSIYSQGTLQAAFSVPMERVLEDVRDETASLAFTQTDGSSISIKARRSSPAVTGLAIRVGFWGDPAISRLILDRITANLERTGSAPTPAPSPTPAPETSPK